MPGKEEGARAGLRRFGRSRAAKKEALEAEREQARSLQLQWLPRETPQLDGFRIACAWRPSDEVSGDYFDVFAVEGERLALCIADVSGKGAAAAALMGELHEAVRKFAPEAESPADLCAQVNQALCRPGSQTRYATMFYGNLDRPGRLRYESAGHCLPLLLRGDGGVEFPASFSGVIGLFSHWLYQNQEVELGPGDCLLLITDGILLAENRRQEEFGYQRLIAAAKKGRDGGADAVGDEVLSAVTEFCGGRLQDEASLIVVCREELSQTPA
ncbi:MAG TPA: PP2C family protein-serine/threonine phosphatase [Acidobacteriaceae bacterium]|jgi:sigma-B regulation protein RsbU (phosphoserine phosphatase)|nr:PP2C family protein-serine/threonine phosphatase [Acidobacteriaceae bacterium]